MPARNASSSRASDAGPARGCADLFRRRADGARDSYRCGLVAHARCELPAATADAREGLRLRSGGARNSERAQPASIAGGEQEDATADQSESVAVIETVIDDSSPQLLGYVSDLLLAAGAWDVYRASVQMKKGRTGVQVTVLCRPDLVPVLEDLLFRETTTIGLRWRLENKRSLAREFQKVQTEWGEVTIKIARWPNGTIANASPEYEDCRKLATDTAPLKQVMQQAMRAYAAGTEKDGV